MSYAIYKTDAIVMRTIPSGEASIDAVLFTREFGKITVRAQSARKQESKMRMFLTRFRPVTVDVVRGRAVWRLTGITGKPGPLDFSNEQLLQPVYRMFRLAEFLIQGEESHPELYDFFVQVLHLSEGFSAAGLEVYCVVKVLDHLGYWQGERLPDVPTREVVESCVLRKKELVKMVNESISATQIMVY